MEELPQNLYSKEEAETEAELLKTLVESGQAEDYSGAEKLLFEQYAHLLEKKEAAVQIEVRDISEQIDKELGDWVSNYLELVDERDSLQKNLGTITKMKDGGLSGDEKDLVAYSRLQSINGQLEQILTEERLLKLHNFVDDISGGRYLQFDTLNHQMWGDPGGFQRDRPKIEMNGEEEMDVDRGGVYSGLYVLNFHNQFLKPEHPFLILGDRNSRFIPYIKTLLDNLLNSRLGGSISYNNGSVEIKRGLNITENPEQKLQQLEEKLAKCLKPIGIVTEGNNQINYSNYNVGADPLYQEGLDKLVSKGVKNVYVPDYDNFDQVFDQFNSWQAICLAILQKKDFFISGRQQGVMLPPKDLIPSGIYSHEEYESKKPKIAVSDIVECIVDIRNKKVTLIR